MTIGVKDGSLPSGTEADEVMDVAKEEIMEVLERHNIGCAVIVPGKECVDSESDRMNTMGVSGRMSEQFDTTTNFITRAKHVLTKSLGTFEGSEECNHGSHDIVGDIMGRMLKGKG